ncbi:MAG TPA: TonB family protein [Pyrinomonadaceae bacterium]
MNSGGPSIGEVVASGDKDGLRLLLSRGADVNETNKGGQTPLILAVVSNQVRLLPLLLEAGADPLLRDKTGLNAIEWAERKGLFEVASELRDRTLGYPKEQKRDSGDGQEKQTRETSSPPPQTSEKNLADVEKSRRWIAGIKQRLDEQASRRQSDADTSITDNEAIPETAPEEIKETSSPIATVPEINEPHSVPESERRPASLKKCPQCGAVYNSDLVAYCSYHTVPLVDLDTPIEAYKTPDSGSNVLLWLLVIITFLSAALVGLMFFPRTDQNAQRVTPPSNPTPTSTWKGAPIAEASLKTKVVNLPEAQTAVKIEKPETVVVRVRIGSDGRVLSVQALSGNEELRRAATDAARKATFAADKLHGRESTGTITYTFNP